jgi:hypothetical protein
LLGSFGDLVCARGMLIVVQICHCSSIVFHS